MGDDLVSSLLELAPILAPGCRDLSDEEKTEMRQIISEAIRGRTTAIRRRLSLFLWLLFRLPIVRYGRPLDRLSDEQGRSFLAWMGRSPILPFRAGLLGIRTLVFMGYYGRKGADATCHFHPMFEGNRKLPDG